MTSWGIWLTLAAVLLVAELLTGTFYLLVLALAMGSAGLGALAAMPVWMQFVVAAAIGVGGSLWLRQQRPARRGHHVDAADALQRLDVGQRVHVAQWNADRTARTGYRGADWDVDLVPEAAAVPGEFEIRAVQGSRLLVAPVLPS
jgi:membrane protein implicated in regulation of membrane protease activity